jgi:DNA-binding SARP family transcriptional activator
MRRRGVEFRLLGPLEVLKDGEALALGGPRQRAVLAVLLLHANDVVPTDRLLDQLWGEQLPPTAATSLQNCVSQLRRLLGAERVITRTPGYRLQVEQDELDLHRFERLVKEARGAEAQHRSRSLREALDLWRGAPLVDFTYERFAEHEIARLEELRWSVLEDRIEADLEIGRHGELVPELETMLKQQPLRERLRGQLMLALYRSGRQAEALAVYGEGRRFLVEELGIEPGPTLQQLHRSILRQESLLEPVARTRAGEDHYDLVVKGILAGRLVPVLGNDVGPLGGAHAGVDLADHLSQHFECPPEYGSGLARVAQYVALHRGVGPLYDELHGLFDRDFAPGDVHRAVAAMAKLLGEAGRRHQLVVSSNYDHVLEQAFTEAGEPFDVCSYIAFGRDRGKFLHLGPDGSARVIDVPNTYSDLDPDRRSVVLKIHGQVDRRPDRSWDSFVVSEDDYIGYLAQAEIASVVPVILAARLRRSHFLFLGYALREWNLRVFLHRVWGDEAVVYRSWAVQPHPDPVDVEFWRQRGVDTLDAPLDEYVHELTRRLAKRL